MAKTWTIQLDGQSHVVTLDRGSSAKGRKVVVDGQEIELKRPSFLEFGSDEGFPLDGHQAMVHIRTNGLTFSEDLSVDGRSVTTGQHVEPLDPLPRWAWGFIIANLVLVPLGGLIGGIFAALGAWSCAMLARRPSLAAGARIGICAGITIGCWVLTLVIATLVRASMG
jgi:hypothetical protein